MAKEGREGRLKRRPANRVPIEHALVTRVNKTESADLEQRVGSSATETSWDRRLLYVPLVTVAEGEEGAALLLAPVVWRGEGDGAVGGVVDVVA